MTSDNVAEFGELWPDHSRQTGQMQAINEEARSLVEDQTEQVREINAEALRLAESECLEGKLGIFVPDADRKRLIAKLVEVREALCPMTGQFDPEVFNVALAEEGNLWPESIRLDVINQRAREIAPRHVPAEPDVMAAHSPDVDH